MCSGHGTCGKYDQCTCYLRDKSEGTSPGPAFIGGDCSLRTCPTGNAWIDTPKNTNEAHQTAECSNRGSCDRETGLCECYPGYDGKACERMACPNDCSGRGICKTLKDIFTYHYSGKLVGVWDAEKAMGCQCDTGFRGPDCSLNECPSEADVMGGQGADQGRECSGRGKCNYETGICECYAGYYGTACTYQSTYFSG